MTEEKTNATFAGKTPLDPAVEKILAAHGELKPGDRITYKLIADCSLEHRHSDRGRAIIAKWKRHLEADNIILRNIPTVGYEVCNTTGRILTAHTKEQQARKRIGKALYIANNSDQGEMTNEQVGYVHHLNRTYASIMLFERVKPKQLQLPE